MLREGQVEGGNRVLWRVSGPNMGEIIEFWRKPHNEELNNLYSSPNIRITTLRMRWARHAMFS
jgi:hypothetical protein